MRPLAFAFGTSALALALAAASSAAAQCTPNPTVPNGTTQCHGTDTGGVVVATPGSTVIVPVGATVSANSASAITIDVPFENYATNYETVSVAGHVQGIGTSGITLNNGTNSGFDYYGPTTSLTLNVAAGGVIEGTTAVSLGQSSGNTYGIALATIDNAGTLTGTSGIALQAGNPSTGAFASITNRSSGTIGAISGPVGTLNNAGTIDGGANSAIDTGGVYNAYAYPDNWTNSGTITSSASTATLNNVFAPVTNSGTISNTGSGAAVQGVSGNLMVTNQSSGVISAAGGTAITTNGGLTLVNAGTINGNVVVATPIGTYFGSTIDSTGGTINGNVTLGSSNDVVVAHYNGTSTLQTGINGTIDGGGGIDNVQIATTRDTVIDTAVTLPAGFQLQVAPAAGTTLTLADGFVAPSTIGLYGAGSVVNNTTLTFAGQAFTSQYYEAPVSFTNAGSIITTGGTVGTPALSLGVMTFTNTGTINVAGTGVSVSVNGTTTNSGTITATGTALTAFDNVVTNSGTIRSTEGIGLALSGNVGIPAYNSGLIEGATVGVYTDIYLFNSGTVRATNADGVAVALDAYGSLYNLAGGVIGNGGTAVTASIYNSTVANAGTINGDVRFTNLYSGAGESYIALPGGVLNGNLVLGASDLLVTDLVNTGSGAFAGITGTVDADPEALLRYRVSSDASATLGPVGPFQIAGYQLTNNATLNLTAPSEITRQLQLGGTGTVNLDASISTDSVPAIVSAYAIPVPGEASALNQLNIVSAGTISVTSAPYDYLYGAVYLGGNDSFTNNGTIHITDAQSYPTMSAVYGGAAVTNNGAIGLDGGIGVSQSATLVNTGTIMQVANGAAAQGVRDVAALDNSGTIEVEGDAVANSGYWPMSIVNRASGVIATTGAQSVAISAYSGLSLDNAGTIASAPGGIAIQAMGYTTSAIRNTGTIRGDVLLGYGSIVENAGLIDGKLTFGWADDQLILLPGSTITGTVDGGDGEDLIALAGTGKGSFAGAVNFEYLDVASGDWTLTGASTFAEGTNIESGASLTGTSDTLTGAILDHGTLVVDQATNGALTASIGGTGLFRKTGTGTLTVGSQPYFKGRTDVAGGTLRLEGSLASAVTVESGAKLAGTGTVASATILKGGTIAPDVGTFQVAGDFGQQTGSTYDATILAGGISSHIAVGGIAAIGSGATISINRVAGAGYAIGTRYTLLTAAGGIAGAYTLDQTAVDGTELRLVATDDTLFADLVRTGASLRSLAVTRDQAAVAGAFGALDAGNSAYATLTLNPDDAAVRGALTQLSGEIHASAKTAQVHDAMLAEGAALSRIETAGDQYGLWGQFLGGHGEDDGTGGGANVERNTTGGIGGYDVALGTDARAGLAAGYTHTRLTLDGRANSAKLDTGHVLGYAGGAFGALRLRAGIGYAWSRIDTRRTVSFAGFSDHDDARYDGDVLHAFGELGYALPVAGGTVEPFVGGSALRVHNAGFTEHGGDAALAGLSHSDTVEFSDVGVKIATPVVRNVSAHAGVAWQHAFGAVSPDAVLRFDGGDTAFSVTGARLSRDAVTPTFDIAWQMAPKVRLSAGYTGLIGRQGSENSGRVALGIAF